MIINEDMLRNKVPAAFAQAPEEGKTSSRYSFLPTTDIIEILQEEGWEAWSGSQVNPRKWSRDHAKHIVRMRQGSQDTSNFGVGDSFPEMLIMNAHNGLGGYTLQGGVYRMVCSNGMVIAESDFGKINIRHIGFEAEQVKEASRQFVATTFNISDKIKMWENTTLGSRATEEYLADAAKLRFEDADEFLLRNLSSSRRQEDNGTSLWKLHNRVQENLIQGGFLNESTRRQVRKITSIQKDIQINAGLWDLTSQYAESMN